MVNISVDTRYDKLMSIFELNIDRIEYLFAVDLIDMTEETYIELKTLLIENGIMKIRYLSKSRGITFSNIHEFIKYLIDNPYGSGKDRFDINSTTPVDNNISAIDAVFDEVVSRYGKTVFNRILSLSNPSLSLKLVCEGLVDLLNDIVILEHGTEQLLLIYEYIMQIITIAIKIYIDDEEYNDFYKLKYGLSGIVFGISNKNTDMIYDGLIVLLNIMEKVNVINDTNRSKLVTSICGKFNIKVMDDTVRFNRDIIDVKHTFLSPMDESKCINFIRQLDTKTRNDYCVASDTVVDDAYFYSNESPITNITPIYYVTKEGDMNKESVNSIGFCKLGNNQNHIYCIGGFDVATNTLLLININDFSRINKQIVNYHKYEVLEYKGDF